MWVRPLIDWYLKHQRDLPWRIHPHPYHTLVSEFMAQQTQLITVIPYYERWLSQYPLIQDAAQASEDSILKSWEGLGYYSRARHLHKTCQIISTTMNGVVPNNIDVLLSLPGVGPYIAAAVASIAYEQPIAVVDGNVLRVVSRLFGLTDDISKDKTKQSLQQRLNHDIKHAVPSQFNQAIMELGAIRCLPKQPRCSECPLNSICYAYNMNKTEELPVKPKKPPIPHHTIVVGIIKNKKNQFLITKRKKNQLLGGLWEFPGGKVIENETLECALIREIKEEVNLDITIDSFLCKVHHAYSHFKVTLMAYICLAANNSKVKCNAADDYNWVPISELGKYAFPKANRVIIEELKER
jgi:A/G-specific adenine glycosylase